MKRHWKLAAFAPFALAAALPAAAAGYGMTAGSSAQGQSGASGQAQVLSGGVGEGARDQLAQQAKGYELKLVFTSNQGAYLADVPVQVSDAKGNTVVDSVSQGPWMFIDLPPGQYTVKASYGGKTESRRVAVGHGQKTMQFRWSDPDVTVASDITKEGQRR